MRITTTRTDGRAAGVQVRPSPFGPGVYISGPVKHVMTRAEAIAMMHAMCDVLEGRAHE